MLASVGDAPEGAGWAFEPKYDGVRVLAVIESGAKAPRVRLLSRNGNDKAPQFPELVAALERWAAREGGPSCVLDGEVVALDAEGAPERFQSLQGRIHANAQRAQTHANGARAGLVVFDVLFTSGVPVTDAPWEERRVMLERLFRGTRAEWPLLRVSEVSEDRHALLATAKLQAWEGLIAKRVSAVYLPGVRTRDWLKLKLEQRQEFVIGGWTDPERSRPGIGALLVGYHDDQGFRYAGRVGTGFSHDLLRRLRTMLQPFERSTPPFVDPPRAKEGRHWVEPRLVCEVRFTEWTTGGSLRHPAFLGLRDDLDPTSVRREPVAPATTVTTQAVTREGTGAKAPEPSKGAAKMPARAITAAPRNVGPRRARPPLAEPPLRLLTQIDTLAAARQPSGVLHLPSDRAVAVTNLDRVLIPAAGKTPAVTKAALLRYYACVAPVLLPAIADRPLILRRFPHGADGEAFYQQHAPVKVPAGVRTSLVGDDPKPRFIGGDLTTLLHLVQLGAISVDPWHGRLTPEDPEVTCADYAIIDLDPGPRARWSTVIAVAQAVAYVLARLGLESVPKTSGATGLHIVVPMPAHAPAEAARLLAELVASEVVTALPTQATIVRSVAARKASAVYVDYLQNIRGKSVASVYSARARTGGTVSTPLRWDEVTPDLDPKGFTVQTVPNRVQELGDLWGDGMRAGRAHNTRERLADAFDGYQRVPTRGRRGKGGL